jgi:hypothetical protein
VALHAPSIQRPAVAATLLAIAVGVLAGGPVAARAEAGTEGSWQATGPMAEGWSAGASAVTLADGRVLAVSEGGSGAEQGATQLYDPASGTWTLGPSLHARGPWTVVALAGGGALILGGTSCGDSEVGCLPTTSAYRLSPSGTEISPAAPMPESRARPVAVQLGDSLVLVAGGFGDECPKTIADGYSCQPLASAEIYDPASNEWFPTSSMPQARGGASATLLSDGTVLVAGGGEGQGAIRYDPGSGSWTAAGQTAAPRTGSLLLPLPGDRALVLGSQPEAGFFGSLGGAGERAQLICRPITSEIFAAASSAWTALPAEPLGSENCVAPSGALLSSGQILLGSILSYPHIVGPPSSPYQVLDAEQRCWSTTTPPVAQRSEGVMAALADGRALVFGGQGPSRESLSSAEIYTPGSLTCLTGTPSNPTPSDPSPSGKQSRAPRFGGATILHSRHPTIIGADALRLLLRCPAGTVGRCVGHVRATLFMAASTSATSRRKPMPLGSASISIAPNRTRWVTVHFTQHKQTLHSLIHRWHQATIALTATTHDGDGQTATTGTSEIVREPTKASTASSPR